MIVRERVYAFTKIQIMKDMNLSWAAKGLLAYINCHPEKDELFQIEGVDEILNELVEKGYMKFVNGIYEV